MIRLPEKQIIEFCYHYHIRKLALFGSILRDDFHADSDIDVLVEFDPEHAPDLLGFSAMQDELSNLMGRQVDLNTPDFLSRHFRKKVLENAKIIYERT